MAVGRRIFLKRELANQEVIKELGEIPAANIADVMERNCAMNPRIHLVSNPQNKVMAGSALTVKVRAGDNLALHAALNMATEGDVIVVSNEGDNTRALMGEIMMTYLCYFKKIAGIILDGPIRDIDEIGGWNFPVYATGTTPGGPYKEGPGEVNVPISCGEVSVNPGDIIVADKDGIIVIPKRDSETILAVAKKLHANDSAKAQAAKTGSTNRDWVTKLLDEKKFEFIDDIYKY
ncbi:methyltransferase [Fusobacterium nucleatum]|uniref:Regulator of ribonuclease activity homolog n=1 Tax=Fusobacterium nucleatum TaxID=851 RepID=A0A2N6TEW1_FUSNU|nr:RraA family protein [Fusobacterium nucleatum]PMC67848.1 methyltransferase [Fusobacterium nucleatum]